MINKYTIEINCYDAFQILMFSFGMFFLLWFLFLHLWGNPPNENEHIWKKSFFLISDIYISLKQNLMRNPNLCLFFIQL